MVHSTCTYLLSNAAADRRAGSVGRFELRWGCQRKLKESVRLLSASFCPRCGSVCKYVKQESEAPSRCFWRCDHGLCSALRCARRRGCWDRYVLKLSSCSSSLQQAAQAAVKLCVLRCAELLLIRNLLYRTARIRIRVRTVLHRTIARIIPIPVQYEYRTRTILKVFCHGPLLLYCTSVLNKLLF